MSTIEKKNMVIKKYRVNIGRLLDLHFTHEKDALNFIDGFNFARRQREEILYEFKDKYKSRGFAFAFKVLWWMDKQNISDEWYNTRPYLTDYHHNGNGSFGLDISDLSNQHKNCVPHSAE
jgi:hypothetical protein